MSLIFSKIAGLGLVILPSQVETLFAYQKWEDTTQTKILNMGGKKSLIIITPNNTGENTLIEDSAETQDFALGPLSIDGVLQSNGVAGAGDNKFIYFDFGSVASREVFVNAEIRNLATNSANYEIQVQTATTKPTWATKATIANTSSVGFGSQPVFPYDSGAVVAAHSFRYLRLRTVKVSGSGDFVGFAIGEICVTSLYDAAIALPLGVGATPSATFTLEVKDDLTGDWLPLASAGQVAITPMNGQGSLKELGFEGGSAQHILLPDDATHLRAKMVVNAGMKTGMFVIKI